MSGRRPADVTGLGARVVREGVVLTWAWPEGCSLVRVVRRTDGWPEGPEDPVAVWRACSRSEYVAAGERFVERLGDLAGRFHYAVFAARGGRGAARFSAGASEGSRAAIEWEPWTTVRYDVVPENGVTGGRLRVRWSVDRVLPEFAGFALMASPDDVPASLEDGLELFRWAPWMDHSGPVREALVDLEPVRRRRWPRVFCKALTVDPAQRHTTLLVHPNTCWPVSPTGLASRHVPAPMRFRREPPSRVVCPSCFGAFAASEILFASYTDDPPEPSHRSLVARITGAPPRPPVNSRGRRLTRKLCPACSRDLPFAAGVRPSLVLGLIGAKFSGKSHYVAALVKALEGQVGADFDASLVAVNDETQDRYRREFYEPLFGRGLELPVTVGTPPPLIYDLSVGGGGATLSLYDTAGENFDDREIVARMLAYLGVASGVVLLVDPLQAPAVREALPPGAGLPDLDRMADPHAIVGRVLHALDAGAAAFGNGRLDVPVAVVLTKCDVLRDAGLVEANRLWLTEARHTGAFDRAIHEDMSGMFGEYLLRWSPATFSTVVRRFPRHAFFGVSATGCASDPATRRYPYVAPWRVEEPFLWLLAELGLVRVQ